MNALKFKHINKWSRPSNYAGSTFEGYYIGFGQSRDSDTLELCNFKVALERLGGESSCDCETKECSCAVIVARAGHWACGWVEPILVHESATDKLEILESLKEDMENYPVLDDDEFSQMECDEQNETFDQYKDQFKEDLLKFLGLKDQGRLSTKQIESVTNAIYSEDCSYCGNDDAWVSERAIKRFIGTYEHKQLIEDGNKVAIKLAKVVVAS